MSKTDMSNQELRRVAEEATPGPWVAEPGREDLGPLTRWFVQGVGPNWGDVCEMHNLNRDANARFIATFDPPFVLSLLDRVERLEELLGAAEGPLGYAYRNVNSVTADRVKGEILPAIHAALSPATPSED